MRSRSLAVSFTFLALTLAGAVVRADQPPPNVLLIMTDDQGDGDLACHGNPVINTPNLDRLHAESVRFTYFHVDPGQKTNVAREHLHVVERLKQDFDAYWRRVSPGDRDRVTFIVGHPSDPETYLQPMDWYLPMPPWNHQHVARGAKQCGAWWIAAAETGVYRFEARRWPAEVDAPVTGVPQLKKTVDAWDAGGGKPTLIYAGEQSPFSVLPVAFIRLRVGDFEDVKPVRSGDTKIAFDVPLEAGKECQVQAELLDAKKAVIAGAYYVYCRKKRSTLKNTGTE